MRQKQTARSLKVAVVTCYDQVETHVRPRLLRSGLARCKGVETLVIKNKQRGLLRYVEVPCRLVWAWVRHRPDVYVLTFRGYEMLPLTLLLAGHKPVIFDELVNAVAYLREHGKLRAGTPLDSLFRVWYGWLVRRCRFVLADTDAHAELSSDLSRAPRDRFVTIPIGAEEDMFYPGPDVPRRGFTVFYYGVMTKLHGLEHFLDAAARLSKRYPDMTFVVGGDKGKSAALYEAARRKGARLELHKWFPYEELPEYAHKADVCVGGPFGDTSQSQFIITTKTFQFLAAARPVLIGRNRVNTAFVDKQNSLVVPQGDVAALEAAIVWAYDHPKQLQAVGQAGRKLYEQQFSQELIDKRLQALLDDCRP